MAGTTGLEPAASAVAQPPEQLRAGEDPRQMDGTWLWVIDRYSVSW